MPLSNDRGHPFPDRHRTVGDRPLSGKQPDEQPGQALCPCGAQGLCQAAGVAGKEIHPRECEEAGGAARGPEAPQGAGYRRRHARPGDGGAVRGGQC